MLKINPLKLQKLNFAVFLSLLGFIKKHSKSLSGTDK